MKFCCVYPSKAFHRKQISVRIVAIVHSGTRQRHRIIVVNGIVGKWLSKRLQPIHIRLLTINTIIIVKWTHEHIVRIVDDGIAARASSTVVCVCVTTPMGYLLQLPSIAGAWHAFRAVRSSTAASSSTMFRANYRINQQFIFLIRSNRSMSSYSGGSSTHSKQ